MTLALRAVRYAESQLQWTNYCYFAMHSFEQHPATDHYDSKSQIQAVYIYHYGDLRLALCFREERLKYP